MALFTRREAPPADLVALLPPDERVVSWGDVAEGGVVVATPRGLWWPDPSEQRFIGWQFIDKAVWHSDRLTVTEAEVVDDILLVDLTPISVTLSKPRDLPPTIRKRIEANVVRSELLAVGGGAARFVARRVPGQDGVTWWARLEQGAQDSPQIRSAISARLAILRSEWNDSLR